MIDANSAQVWTALITVGGGIATLIIQNIFAARGRERVIAKQDEAITKIDSVHGLANGALTAGAAREATQAAVIQELRTAQASTAQATATGALAVATGALAAVSSSSSPTPTPREQP